MEIMLTTELVVGSLSVVGAVLLILKRSGYVTLGQPKERRDCARKCAEHEQVVGEAKRISEKFQSQQEQSGKDLQDLKASIHELRKEVSASDKSTQIEFRKLHRLMGYVRGMHERLEDENGEH